MKEWLKSKLTDNKAACLQIRNRLYPEHEWPGEIYLADIRAHKGDMLLEVGCGWRGGMLYRASDCYRYKVGLDPDCKGGAHRDETVRLVSGDGAVMPFPDSSFDVVAMQNVAEHFEDASGGLRECSRVLRPGGHLIIQTVNDRFPPIALSKLMPHRLRIKLNSMVSGTDEHDIFPAYYRANSMSVMRRLAQAAGLEPVTMRYLPHHPTYFLFSPLVYRAAVLLERTSRRIRRLDSLRHFLHVVFVKTPLK